MHWSVRGYMWRASGGMRRGHCVRATRCWLAVLALVWLPLATAPVQAQAATCGPVPVGQANPSSEPELMQPIWCVGNLAVEPTTRQVDRWGGWQDGFGTNVQMGRLNDGDMDYRVFNSNSANRSQRTVHFVNNNHWMVDILGGITGGALMRPNQAFRFQNGKLVVEGDVAAAVSDYLNPGGGQDIWPEIVITNAPQPVRDTGTYAGDMFPGYWVYRCILYPNRALGCAYLNNSPLTGTESNYAWKSSTHLSPSTSARHFGGEVGVLPDASRAYWRQCSHNQMDMYCRDRFRIEITQNSVTEYVNGVKALEDVGMTGADQIADALVNGNVFVYFADWTTPFTDAAVIRYHWGRLAVNPHDANGNLLAPSVAPSFCLGKAQNTCPMGTMNASSSMPGMQSGAGMTSPMPAVQSMPEEHRSGTDAHFDEGYALTPHPLNGDDKNRHRAGAAQAHSALAALLNSGQQPLFWLVLGLMTAGAAAAGVVVWLWLGRPRSTG